MEKSMGKKGTICGPNRKLMRDTIESSSEEVQGVHGKKYLSS
jgi:hypothetical protein